MPEIYYVVVALAILGQIPIVLMIVNYEATWQFIKRLRPIPPQYWRKPEED